MLVDKIFAQAGVIGAWTRMSQLTYFFGSGLRLDPPRKLQPENYLLSLISQLAKENASKKTFYTGPDPCYPI